MNKATIEDLRKVIALSDLPDEHLQWILDRSDYKELNDGELMAKTGDVADVLWFMYEGKCNFYMDVNGKLVHYYTFENDNISGGAGGLLPYSRMKIIPGNTYAIGTVKGILLNKKYFPELEQLNPALIQRLIGYMTERAKSFATTKLQHEKVNALGQLAAGIAHELNNPASAINRISSELQKKLKRNYELTENLLLQQINSEHLELIRNMVSLKEAEKKATMTALQKINREDEFTDWFSKNNFTNTKLSVEIFTEEGFTVDDLDDIRQRVGHGSTVHVLVWLENLISSQRLLKDLNDASCRISNLVGAIKSHVHMDRTNELQPTNIHKDIDNTLTLLGFKLRDKNITLTKKYCDNLQKISVFIGELNQVWTNLIDNAIYAVERNGEITIETLCDTQNLTVRIRDNGSGIPAEIMSRIFDPFFTTKKVGQGTGIGLDLVNRIIKRHNGEIKVNSMPGKTEFSICLPFNKTN